MLLITRQVFAASTTVVAAAALALTGALSAVASSRAAAPGPAPPSPAAQVAAHVVADYIAGHTRPVSPVYGDPAEDWNAFAGPEYEFLSGFPFEAGLAQWDCRLVGAPQVELIPADDANPAMVFHVYGSNCGDGYRPTPEEVVQVRPTTGTSAPESDAPAAASLGCSTIAGGSHCLSFTSSQIVGRYTWLGGLMHGRMRIGNASVVWPSCNSGTTRAATQVTTLTTNDAIEGVLPRTQSANWSLAFDQANAGGVITGERSVYCEAG